MTPEDRAKVAMSSHFGNAAFAPAAYEAIEKVMAKVIRDVIAEEREACAHIAEVINHRVGREIGAMIRMRS